MLKKFQMKLRREVSHFLNDEAGEIGLKQIAITVGIIVIVGIAITVLRSGVLEDWMEAIFDIFEKGIDSILD